MGKRGEQDAAAPRRAVIIGPLVGVWHDANVCGYCNGSRELQSRQLSILCNKWPQVGTQANIGVGCRLAISYNMIQQDEFKVFKEAAKVDSLGARLANACP